MLRVIEKFVALISTRLLVDVIGIFHTFPRLQREVSDNTLEQIITA